MDWIIENRVAGITIITVTVIIIVVVLVHRICAQSVASGGATNHELSISSFQMPRY